MKRNHPSVFKVLVGFGVLFIAYQVPIAVMHYFRDVEVYVLLMFLFLLLAWLIARWQGLSGWKAYGLTSLFHSWKYWLTGWLTGLVFFSAGLYLAVHYDIVRIRSIIGWEILRNKGLLFLGITLISSLASDILTRGYLYRFLYRRISPEVFVIFSAIVSTGNDLYHVQGGITMLVYLFVTGVMLASPLLLTGNLWYTNGIHWAGLAVFRTAGSVLMLEKGSSPIPVMWVPIAVIVLLIPVNSAILRQFPVKNIDRVDRGKVN